MLRGFYTSISSMRAQEIRMNTISNNLANTNTNGFKQDITVQKSFPEMLMRRTDSLNLDLPLDAKTNKGQPVIGRVDLMPVIGTIGTGVEVNEVYTSFEQGSPLETENPCDLLLEGDGFFAVKTPNNEERYTRNGSFTIGKLKDSLDTILMTKDGFPVLDEEGKYIPIKENNFKIDTFGNVTVNKKFQNDPLRLVSSKENNYDEGEVIAKLKIVDFENKRYLEKQGNSLYKATYESGAAEIKQNSRPKVVQGFLESSNVDPIRQMVDMIAVNRAYDANQKLVHAEDEALEKLINQGMKI